MWNRTPKAIDGAQTDKSPADAARNAEVVWMCVSDTAAVERILFAPDGVAFAQRVMTAKSLRFGYTPHNAEPVEAQFQVDGLAELIAPAAKDCGWQK